MTVSGWTTTSVRATKDSRAPTDFFTVPSVSLRVIFVFLVLQHQRRKVLHFGVTEHPTAEWAAQQIVEAFANRDAKRYLIRDRDASYFPSQK
jgi:hypothetical protein